MASSLLFIFFFFFICFSVSSSTSSVCKFPEKNGAEVNGMFVFGSSLVDTGNNNFLEGATARSDFLPYGIDFPTGPSGRFSNGKNLIDGLSELLKIPSTIPPFKHPSTKGDRIIHGVDFASGGSGILNETGSRSGHVINFNEQIQNFEEVIRPQLEAQLCTSGSVSSSNSSELTTFDAILSDYLFVLGVGGNDYLLNYFLDPTSKYKNMTLPRFTFTLISSLSTKIEKLYSLGGRKFVLVSIYPVGCIPAVKSLGEVLKSKSDRLGFYPSRPPSFTPKLNTRPTAANRSLNLVASSIGTLFNSLTFNSAPSSSFIPLISVSATLFSAPPLLQTVFHKLVVVQIKQANPTKGLEEVAGGVSWHQISTIFLLASIYSWALLKVPVLVKEHPHHHQDQGCLVRSISLQPFFLQGGSASLHLALETQDSRVHFMKIIKNHHK